MRSIRGVFLFFLVFLSGILISTVFGPFLPENSTGTGFPFTGIQATFCPSLSCETLPLSVIHSAHSRVWVAMYSFTHEQLADALIEAHARGVDVRVIVEKQQASSTYSQQARLSKAGIPVRVDTNPNLMHDKFAVVDDSIVITGSMNWTGNGVRGNNENIVVIHSAETTDLFESEFEKLWEEFR